jgi:hypothetical protein
LFNLSGSGGKFAFDTVRLRFCFGLFPVLLRFASGSAKVCLPSLGLFLFKLCFISGYVMVYFRFCHGLLPVLAIPVQFGHPPSLNPACAPG